MSEVTNFTVASMERCFWTRADTAKLVVTGFGSLIYEVYYAVCCQGEHQGF